MLSKKSVYYKQANDIRLKETVFFSQNKYTPISMDLLVNQKFPICLRLANITPAFKNGALISKNSYRPVSIHPVFSKVFERLLQNWLLEFFDNTLSEFHCGFRTVYDSQSCLLMILELFKDTADQNQAIGALLTNLSKEFGCLFHNLLTAKLYAYGLNMPSLDLLQDYLSKRK